MQSLIVWNRTVLHFLKLHLYKTKSIEIELYIYKNKWL